MNYDPTQSTLRRKRHSHGTARYYQGSPVDDESGVGVKYCKAIDRKYNNHGTSRQQNTDNTDRFKTQQWGRQ